MLFPQELFLSPDSRAALPLPCVEMQAGMRDALSLRLAEQSKEVQFLHSFHLLCIISLGLLTILLCPSCIVDVKSENKT